MVVGELIGNGILDNEQGIRVNERECRILCSATLSQQTKKRLTLPRRFRASYYTFCTKTSRAISVRQSVKETYGTDYSEMPVFLRSRCRIDSLKFNIHGLGRVSIWETPHYEFLTTSTKAKTYQRYIADFYGPIQVQTSIERFRMLENYVAEFPQRNVILARSEFPWSKWLLVIDGTHRAAIAASQGRDSIDVVLTNQ